jgi:type VI secretion system protein ImpK
MSRQEFASLKKSSNVVWRPKALRESHEKPARPENNQGYYRSQAFLTSHSVNPLVAAAYPLLTIGARLSELDQYPDITHLHQILVHEMRVFENQSRHREYRQNVVVIARYLLCVFLDEIILQSIWGKSWKQCCLQTTFHHEDTSKEHAFDIIDRLLSQPTQYIDLLELGYLCFSFGLKNKQHQNMPDDILEKLDKIYRVIREERGEISHGFLVEGLPHQPTIQPKNTSNRPFLLMLSFFTGIIIFAYGFFCYGLKVASDPLTQQLIALSGN